jgi:hypothetical protein
MNAGTERATNAAEHVINFALSSATPRATRRRDRKRPDHPDADLIEHCIEYAMQIAAGLRAKASLVEIAMSDWDAFGSIMIDELRKKFLISLAEDVTRFQRSARDQKTSHIAFQEPRK